VPTAGELNNFFGNITPFYGYYILPNPNLKAETSNNFDLGIRDAEGAFQWEAAAFYGKYRNFIERYANAGSVGTSPVVTLQQSRNQARATIKGIELKARAELGQSWGGVWNLRGGYGYTKGTGADGQGLESISPWQVKLGVGQKAAHWNWELAATHHAAKKQSDVSTSSSALFMTPSFTVLDLTTQVELRKGLRLNLGLFNLTDRKYWNWSDVRGDHGHRARRHRRLQPAGPQCACLAGRRLLKPQPPGPVLAALAQAFLTKHHWSQHVAQRPLAFAPRDRQRQPG
jgi:hemoglobin/transferrin/lactoferrin receptor protein